jgi:hypothetical protein
VSLLVASATNTNYLIELHKTAVATAAALKSHNGQEKQGKAPLG